MKKLFALLVVMLLATGVYALAENNIEIYIDGEKLYTEAEPVNIDERVHVPMRAIFEALDASVEWDDRAKTVWASRDGQHIAVNTLDGTLSTYVYNSDGELYWVESIKLDVPARIIDDFTYVPVRAVSETLGTYVSWDGERERVIIDSRPDEKGEVYYSSNSDFQKLYSIGKNGRGRRKLSEKSAVGLEMYGGDVYYNDKYTKYLYRANSDDGEEQLIGSAVNKIAVSDGYVYYQRLDEGEEKTGPLFRMNTQTRETERLTDNSVMYPEKYRDYIYFNLSGSNDMYAMSTDGKTLHTMDIGNKEYSKLYPFNCIFFGDYILVEDGAWFGNLMRINLDGSDMRTLTQRNAIIFKSQKYTDKIIYMQPDFGQDIYCMNLDGSDNHLVHKGDPKWIDIDILDRLDDTIYYKHPMRKEIYKVNLDGGGDEYICYGDDVQAAGGKLFASFNGLYSANPDGSDQQYIYDRTIKGFAVMDGCVYFKDAQSSKLYMYDYDGRGGMITFDAAGEWVTEQKNDA